MRHKLAKKILKLFLLAGMFGYFGIGVALVIFQKDFIYFPSSQDFNNCPEFADSQKIDINGTRAYYKKNSSTLVVFYHGNAGSSCGNYFLKNEFEKNGLSYLFVEYTGYGNDKNPPAKDAIFKNTRDAADFSARQNFGKVIVVGESLGTAPAVYHSTIAKTDKLLLISPFCRMVEMAEYHYPLYPVSWFLSEKYDNCGLIAQSRAGQILIVHGKRDAVILFEQAEKLFGQVGLAQKKFIAIDSAGHNDIYDYENARSAIFNFAR